MTNFLKKSRDLSYEEIPDFKHLEQIVANFLTENSDLKSTLSDIKNLEKDLRKEHSPQYSDELLKLYHDEICFSILRSSKNAKLEPFRRSIALAIILNDDLLLMLLKERPKIASLTKNHRGFINLAVEHKSTVTLRTLLQYEFDPRKTDNNTLSPIALAAKDQGADYIQSYYLAISEYFNEETSKSLITETDSNKKDAMMHALEGRSYNTTIKFLLDNGADIENNFDQYLEAAAKNGCNHGLNLLLENSPKKISEERILELSNLALGAKNHRTHIILLGKTKNGSASHKAIEDNIAEISDKYSPEDIHQICYEGTLEDFQYLISKFRDYSQLTSAIKKFDNKGKTPLFHALRGNCDSKLVKRLLDEGANPEVLVNPKHQDIDDEDREFFHYYGKDADVGMNALTLCIRRKEPDTLGVILRHHASEELSEKTLSSCARELASERNLNKVVIESFFKNVPKEHLKKIHFSLLIPIFTAGMKFAPEVTAAKIKESFENDLEPSKIRTIFLNAVKDSSVNLVENILENFSKTDLGISPVKPSSRQRNNSQTADSERANLLEMSNSKFREYYGSTSPSISADNIFDIALKKAQENFPDPINHSNESREVLILILKKGIEPEDKTNLSAKLATVFIEEKDYKPNQSICSKLCSALSSIVGLNR